MNNAPDLDDAERRHLATHPACVAARRRAEDAAAKFVRSLCPLDPVARDEAIDVLSTAGLDIARAEVEALDAYRTERGRLYAAD